MVMYIVLFLVSVMISSISQILLKMSANKVYDNKLKEYMNPRVIIAYGMFFTSSLITVIAYKGVPLVLGPVLESVGYVFVAVLSYFFLKEKIGKKKCLGLMLIIVGVIISGIK